MPGGLFSILGVARLKSYLESLGRYAGVQAALTAALLVLITLAAGFGITALTIWLVELYGAALAFAFVAAGFVVVALVLQLVLTVRKRRRAARVAPLLGQNDQTDQAGMSDQTALGSIAAIAVIGYLLGRRI